MIKKPRQPRGKPNSSDSTFRTMRIARLDADWGGPGRRGLAELPVLITGGAGFIGTNVADHYLSRGVPVLLFDNLSRPGVERNYNWLRARHGRLVRIEQADIQDYSKVRRAVRNASKVFHFAAQVAVTTSLENPLHDFEVNARGTLNLLESLRGLRRPPPLIFTSTNKVYGALEDVRLRSSETRYEPEQRSVRLHGFDERRPLDFHSPYGCSKGAAEQYVIDYARTFQLPAVVFRMSCVYGPHQFGTEDQGWVAHFLIRAMKGRPITVYGDGRQVRDILFVEDLVEALVLAHQHIGLISGQAFNIGGGPGRTISLLELVNLIRELQGTNPEVRFDQWRPADQQFYVSDIRKFSAATGWKPRTQVRDGLTRLCQWLRQSDNTLALASTRVPADNVPSSEGALLPGIHSNGVVLSVKAPLPRSKRIWSLGAAEARLARKIIKFP